MRLAVPPDGVSRNSFLQYKAPRSAAALNKTRTFALYENALRYHRRTGSDMIKDNGKIIVRWRSKPNETRPSGAGIVRVFPVRRWMFYLILLPIFVAATLIGIFFFAAFLALFALAAVVLGLRFWWLRRKLRKSKRIENLEGEYIVIKETHIVGTKTDKVGGQRTKDLS
jgi:Flp pilus assembly protein TadB